MIKVQDIGLERAPQRSFKVVHDRYHKKVTRAKKVKVLVEVDKRARGLFKGGPFPSIKYGYRSLGLPPRKLAKIDKLVYQSIDVAGF